MVATTLPLALELTVYAGTTFRREFRWLPDGVIPLDFTGWSASALIGPSQGTAVVELSDSNGGVILTATGQIVMLMGPSQTQALPTGVMAYHLDLCDPTGYVRRFLRGRLSVVTDVRRSP